MSLDPLLPRFSSRPRFIEDAAKCNALGLVRQTNTVHRVTKAAYSDTTPTKTYTYDAGTNAIGRRSSMTDGTGATAWTYDSMGRILTEKQTINSLIKTTSDTYNLDGSVATTTYPSGAVLSATQGADGRPVSETDTTNAINYAQSLLYAPTGQLTSALYGKVSGGYAGIAETNSYNDRGQPKRLQACGLASCTDGASSATPFLLDLSYGYGLGVNDNGNVQGITNNANTTRSQSFTYDDLNRLTSAATSASWGINLAGGIDAWGNLKQTNTVSGTAANPMPVNQAINGKNQFTLLGYTYDTAGNVLADGSASTACAGAAYTWDAEEQMLCALGASYSYDGDGVRVEKTGGGATPTIYWGAGTLAESDTSGNLTSEYIFLGGRRIARRDVATGSVYYYFSDALGSSNTVATAAGALENASDFYPYGGELSITQNLASQKYKFEGKERDPESASLAQPQGLDDFGARFDSSAMGRFMSPDWANKPEPVPYAKMGNPQTLNLYAFAGNNPESAPDLDGHMVSLEQYQAALWSTWHPDQMGDLGEIADESFDAYQENELAKEQKTKLQNGIQRDPTNSVEVVIEYDKIGGLMVGDHASLYVNQNGNWEIYDPDGQYSMQKRAGEADVVTEENGASKSEWEQSSKSKSGHIEKYFMNISSGDAGKIISNIEASVNARQNSEMFPCARSVSTVLSGVGPFKNISVTSRPGVLADQLIKLTLPQP